MPTDDCIRLDDRQRIAMAPRFFTLLTGRNLPKIWQPREPGPSTINEKTIADFTRALDGQGVEYREPNPDR